MESELLISFPDQSKSFTYGVEFGRLLEKIERGDLTITNNKFPIRIENKEIIEKACVLHSYTPFFSQSQVDGWLNFSASRILEN